MSVFSERIEREDDFRSRKKKRKKKATHQHARRRDQHKPLQRRPGPLLRRLHQVARADLVGLPRPVVPLPALGREGGRPRAAGDRRDSFAVSVSSAGERQRGGEAPWVAGVGLDELEPLGELSRFAAEDAGGRALAAGHGSDAVASLRFLKFGEG